MQKKGWAIYSLKIILCNNTITDSIVQTAYHPYIY